MTSQAKKPEIFFQAAICRSVVVRSLKVAAVIGTLLVAINHGDIILNGGELNWFKIILTYFVPYGVATYAAAMQKVSKD